MVISAPPILNPEQADLKFNVVDNMVFVSTHIVANPRVSSVSLRLNGHSSSVVNFTNLIDNNVSKKNNVTLSIVKAEVRDFLI